MSVRVRIAPAPSGSLHLGNVRTALFDWLFARNQGGTFILRVEDTDPSRVVHEHYATIEADLEWMGLKWDEGPYRQSERLNLYHAAAEQLVDKGAAFRCYCTPEELAEKRDKARAEKRPHRYDGRCLNNPQVRDRFVIRLHVPREGKTSFDDLVTGTITFRHDQLDHVVLVRSDGTPLYNLAVTVDDGLMAISHVVRGMDLQSSTPYQIIMHEALANPVPAFAHLPLMNGPDGKPLSKRHGPTSLLWYRENGYLPEAMINYLALQGWGSGDETLFTREELIEKFDLARVHPSPATFDPAKLEWMNGEHIRQLSDEELADRLEPFWQPPNRETAASAAALVKTRIRRLDEAAGLVRGIFEDEIEPDSSALREEFVPELLEKSIAALADLEPWTRDGIESALRSAVEELGLKPRKAFVPLYSVIHGAPIGAPLFESMEMIGKAKTLDRLKSAIS